MSRLQDVIQRGTRAGQPLATAVSNGTLYGVTDEGNIIERSNASAWQAYSPTVAGSSAQVVNTETGAVATGTTTLPFDDTIPQISEGTQFMSLAITPTSATNKLRIEVVFNFSSSAVTPVTAALFQDAANDALAASAMQGVTTTAPFQITFSHYMTAGTTSATTFKVRAGGNAASTITFNGSSAARIFGGVMASSMTITEIHV